MGRVKTPAPLRAFYERIRSRRGMQIAVVATARKLAVLCWHLITKGEDYAFGRPSLTEQKLRELELRAGMPVARAKRADPPRTTSRKSADVSASWPSKASTHIASSSPTGKPDTEGGRGRRQWDATKKALSGASCAAGISPRTCTSLRGRPRPPGSVTLADTRPQTTPRRNDAPAHPNPSLRGPPTRRSRPQEAICGPPSTTRDRSITRKPPDSTSPTLDIFIRRIDDSAHLRGKRQKRGDVLPGVQPRLGVHGESLARLLIEGLKLAVSGIRVSGGVDRFEIPGNPLARGGARTSRTGE